MSRISYATQFKSFLITRSDVKKEISIFQGQWLKRKLVLLASLTLIGSSSAYCNNSSPTRHDSIVPPQNVRVVSDYNPRSYDIQWDAAPNAKVYRIEEAKGEQSEEWRFVGQTTASSLRFKIRPWVNIFVIASASVIQKSGVVFCQSIYSLCKPW